MPGKSSRTFDNREVAVVALCVLFLILVTRYLYAANNGFYHWLYLCPTMLLLAVLVFLAYDVWKRVR